MLCRIWGSIKVPGGSRINILRVGCLRRVTKAAAKNGQRIGRKPSRVEKCTHNTRVVRLCNPMVCRRTQHSKKMGTAAFFLSPGKCVRRFQEVWLNVTLVMEAWPNCGCRCAGVETAVSLSLLAGTACQVPPTKSLEPNLTNNRQNHVL